LVAGARFELTTFRL